MVRWRRLIAINAAVLIALVGILEVSARVAIYYARGSSTAGLQERTLNLEYEPFVMYGPDWDQRFSSIPLTDEQPTVLLVGGSTAQGFAPAILEDALAERFGRTVRVVNAGFGGYEARQEAIVVSLWAPRLNPAVLISLDGHNDLEHRLRVSEPGRLFLNDTYRTYLTRPLIAPVAFMLARSQAYNAVTRLHARRTIADASRYLDAIPIFIDAQHSMTVVARGIGSRRLMVLQSFVSFKQPLAPEERSFTAYAYREPVMRRLYDDTAAAMAELAVRDKVWYVDARGIFDGVSSAVFSDDVHFRDAFGYRTLARVIAEALPGDVFDEAAPPFGR